MLHRPRTLQRNNRKKERKEKKKNWYNAEKYETVMFIPATPNWELQLKL